MTRYLVVAHETVTNPELLKQVRAVKEQEREAEREGPRRPLTLSSIDIVDANIYIKDGIGSNGYRLPERIEDLDLKGAFEYEPVHYSASLEHVSFRASAPELNLSALTGKVAVRDDNLYVDRVSIRTAERPSR